MSTVNVQPTANARSAVAYALYGRSGDRYQKFEDEDNDTRTEWRTCSMGGAKEIVARAEQVSAAFHRRNEMYTYTQNFSPEEFDVNNPEHIQRVHDLGVKLAKRMNSADFLVVTHTDSAGGHLHNHIYVVNHDNLTGKALSRCRSWSRGLRQVNDQLMRDEGCQVLPDPQMPKPDWDLRRGAFKDGGFEQVLGDKVMEALLDQRSVDRESFEQVLAEHEVRLRVTDRDGWTYSMRRDDNGKWGRRKASSLCDEFTAKGAEEVFAFRQKQQANDVQKGKRDERSRKAQAGTASYGEDGGQLDAAIAKLRAADEDRGVAPGLDYYVDLAERANKEDRGCTGELNARVDLQDFNLGGLAARLVSERLERDQDDAERAQHAAKRDQRDRERQASSNAERWLQSESLGSGRVQLDEEGPQQSGDDDYGLG